MSAFLGLEIGKRSIMTHQTALNITGHNMANANTPGYTRQVADLVTVRPWHAPGLAANAKVGQIGTGVEIADIARIRDSFLDAQYRNENKNAGYWTQMEESLARIEAIINEPSEDGLRGVMDSFWEAWQDLSAHPESEAVRSVVAERGRGLAETFRHLYSQLQDLQEDVNATVKVKVDEINSLASQVRDLNSQILSISIVGKQPNDLLDKRDYLLDQLSRMVDIKVYPEDVSGADGVNGSPTNYGGMIAVQLGGRTLVQGVELTKMAVEQDANGMNLVVWGDTRIKARIEGGELRGILDARGKTKSDQERTPSEYKELIPGLMENLNILAKTIVTTTNELHRQGWSLTNKSQQPDGMVFFEEPAEPPDSFMNWAQIMRVDARIEQDAKNIAAAGQPTWDLQGNKSRFGDGTIALAIAKLKHSLNSQDGSNDDFWRKIAAEIGVQSQEAQRMTKNQEMLLTQLDNQRQSVSGVSLDEEMTNMIKFQHAFNAAARLINSIDEQIDTIVNRMGLVGR